jgi:hypothetical protein
MLAGNRVRIDVGRCSRMEVDKEVASKRRDDLDREIIVDHSVASGTAEGRALPIAVLTISYIQ